MTGPVLDTERLRLRPFARDDTDVLRAHWTHPDVRRFLWDGAVVERAQAAAVVEESLATFAARRFGLWVVEDRADGGFVGFAGLRAVPGEDHVELYYGLAPERWGRGYATEAARAVLRHGFETLALGRILVRTDGPNVASIAVIERLGGRHVRTERTGAFGTIVSYVVEPGWISPPVPVVATPPPLGYDRSPHPTREEIPMEYSMVIDGRSVTTGQWDDVINPAKGEPFAQCPRGTKANVDEAVAAAARAFKTWRTDEALRRQKLNECATAIQGNVSDIAAVLSQEQGKPLTAAMAEVFGASMWFSYFANLQVEPEVLTDDNEKTIKVVRKPLGVVAAITPWNFPVILLAWKLAPAWLAGNTVVAKPSPFTPLTSLMVANILKSIVPPGVLNVLSGGNELGAQLASHHDVRKISFTGSVATGKKIASYAAEDLKRVTLELGGNDPAIVLDDVNPQAVAEGLFWSAFQNSGQVCTAVKRLYVHEKVYEPIVRGLTELAKKTKVGPGTDPDVQLGPINNKMQLDRVMSLVEDAKKHGAKIEAGGVRLEGSGYFYPPTIVTNVGPGVKLVDDEQFGTALPVMKFSKIDDAIAQANATHYGLGGSVWTADRDKGMALVQELECGTGWVNHHMDITPYAPFGGSKWSGLGYENGKWGYEAFTELQVVNAKKG